jgi:hypothetical protein
MKEDTLIIALPVDRAYVPQYGRPYTLAVNKAERNAFAKLIPAKWFAVLINEYLQRKQSKPAPGKPEERPPESDQEEWQLRVPVTKDPVAIDGVKQVPLIDGTTAIGMVNVLEDGSQVSIVSERTIKADDPVIANFLVPRVLDQIVAKHPEFRYKLITAGRSRSITGVVPECKGGVASLHPS